MDKYKIYLKDRILTILAHSYVVVANDYWNGVVFYDDKYKEIGQFSSDNIIGWIKSNKIQNDILGMGGRVMNDYDYRKMNYPTSYGTVYGDIYSGYGDNNKTISCTPPSQIIEEELEPIKTTRVQKIEISLSDETIDKLFEIFTKFANK